MACLLDLRGVDPNLSHSSATQVQNQPRAQALCRAGAEHKENNKGDSRQCVIVSEQTTADSMPNQIDSLPALCLSLTLSGGRRCGTAATSGPGAHSDVLRIATLLC
jgi:hypothetical protein